VRIERTDFDHPASATLRKAQQDEIAVRYGTPDSEPGVKPSAADMTVFFVAFDDNNEPVGCGGLRQLDDSHGEIKRMYVRPDSRGSGVSTAIIQTLESYALANGWHRLVLETGDRQPDAVRFYSREGYTRIPNFGHYAGLEASLCFGKHLLAVDPAADTICEGCE
jgi:GNAT superfamily N-acetyltransferase